MLSGAIHNDVTQIFPLCPSRILALTHEGNNSPSKHASAFPSLRDVINECPLGLIYDLSLKVCLCSNDENIVLQF